MGARWLRRRRRWRRQRRRRQRRWRQRRRRRRRRRRHRPALSSHLPSQHDHCSVSVGAGTMRVQAWGWQHATLCYTHAEWMCSAASGSALLVGRVGRCSKGRRRRLHSLLLLASSLPGDHARPSGLLGWRGSPPNTWLGVPGRSRPLTGTLTGTLTGSHCCRLRAVGSGWRSEADEAKILRAQRRAQSSVLPSQFAALQAGLFVSLVTKLDQKGRTTVCAGPRRVCRRRRGTACCC